MRTYFKRKSLRYYLIMLLLSLIILAFIACSSSGGSSSNSGTSEVTVSGSILTESTVESSSVSASIDTSNNAINVKYIAVASADSNGYAYWQELGDDGSFALKIKRSDNYIIEFLNLYGITLSQLTFGGDDNTVLNLSDNTDLGDITYNEEVHTNVSGINGLTFDSAGANADTVNSNIISTLASVLSSNGYGSYVNGVLYLEIYEGETSTGVVKLTISNSYGTDGNIMFDNTVSVGIMVGDEFYEISSDSSILSANTDNSTDDSMEQQSTLSYLIEVLEDDESTLSLFETIDSALVSDKTDIQGTVDDNSQNNTSIGEAFETAEETAELVYQGSVSSIEVSSSTSLFNFWEEFSTEGLTIISVYENGDTKELSTEDCTVDSSAYISTTAGTYTINISYSLNGIEYSCSYDVIVQADTSEPSEYSISLNQGYVNASGDYSSLSFSFTGAEIGATYTYSIVDANEATVTGTGTIITSEDTISGIDVSNLSDGTLTLSVYLTDESNNQGADETATIVKDTIAPTNYSATIDEAITANNYEAISFTFEGAEIGAAYSYSIDDDSNQATSAVTGSGTITEAAQEVTNINVSSLSDGTLTLTVYLTDTYGNQGENKTDEETKETGFPSISSITPSDKATNVAVETDIEIVFDESMDSSNLTDWTITLATGELTLSSGNSSIIYSTTTETNDTITINPTSELKDCTTYGAFTISGFTDSLGNEMEEYTNSGYSIETEDNTEPSGYSIALNQDYVNASGDYSSLSFTFTDAEVGTTYTYSIVDANEAAVTGTGTITTTEDTINGIDVSTLLDGTLTLSVYLTDESNNQGADEIATIVKDTIAPSGYSASIDESITANNYEAISFTFAGAEIGSTYTYSIDDDTNEATAAVTGSGTITEAAQEVTNINLSSLSDGTLTLTVYLTDTYGNQGETKTDEETKETGFPSISSIIPANETTDVAVDSNIVIVFDESMDSTNLTDWIFEFTTNSLILSSGNSAITYTTTTETNDTITINPTSDLTDCTTYGALTISGFRDSFGNEMAEYTNSEYSITTEDNTAPSGYSIALNQDYVNASGDYSSLSFSFTGAEIGATYTYSIVDANEATVTGTGTIETAEDTISGIDVSTLSDGTLTLIVYLTDTSSNKGESLTKTLTKETSIPSNYSVDIDNEYINSSSSAITFSFANAELGSTYTYSIDDDTNEATASVTGTGTITDIALKITDIDVSSLSDGTLTLTTYLTDSYGNQGLDVTDTVEKDTIAPTVTDGNISITSKGSGTDSTYIVGDTIIVSWNNSSSGDNNSDVSMVTIDFSSFGAIETVSASNTDETWTASYEIVSGTIDAEILNVSLTVTDDKGNETITIDTSNLSMDNVEPTVASTTLESSEIKGRQFKLSWTAASDEEGDTLLYQILHSTSSGDISEDSLSDDDWSTYETTTETITGLSLNTTYYFNVYVKDEAGNITAYTSANLTTIGEMEGSGTSSDPFIIESIEDLAGVGTGTTAGDGNDYSLSASYMLNTEELDFTNTASYEDSEGLDIYDADGDDTSDETLYSAVTSGNGWEPIGAYSDRFTGDFDGAGYTISNLYINRSDEYYVGLFGYINGGTISDLTLSSLYIVGRSYVGGLVGYSNSSISNCLLSGDITGEGTDDSDGYVGGLAGYSNSSISNCSSSSSVSGENNYNGGLVGYNEGEISSSYATGVVTGEDSRTGGLVGSNHSTIDDSYATGDVDGRTRVGGLVGKNESTITNCYSTGLVTSDTDLIGGLMGDNADTASYSYYDITTSEITDDEDDSNGVGKTTEQMQNYFTYYYNGWDMVDTWVIESDESYPILQWQDEDADNYKASDTNPTIDDGELTISTSSTSFTLSWTAASDLESDEEDLKYQVVYSSDSNIELSTLLDDNSWSAYDTTTETICDLFDETTYFFNVFVKDEGGKTASYTSSSTTTLDGTAPSGYSVSIENEYINSSSSAIIFSFEGAETGTTYTYSIDDAGNDTTEAVTGSGIIVTEIDSVESGDITGLDDGILTLTVSLIDSAGNEGVDTTDTVVKDTTAATVTDGNINITSTGSGTDSTYIVGDTITVSWNNSSSGDNNSDISTVTVDFSSFGAIETVSASNTDETWTASYEIVSGTIDSENLNVSLKVTNDIGNATTTSDTSNLSLDNVAPTVTDAKINITSTGSGTDSITYIVGDEIIVSWDNSSSGDNNSDISTVTVDFSLFGATETVSASNTAEIWTASYEIVSGTIDAESLNVSLTATDEAGNTVTTSDGSNLSLDNITPTVINSTLESSNVEGHQFSLSWTAASDEEDTLQYQILYSTSSDDIIESLLSADNLSSYITTEEIITPLSAETTYYFNVYVKDNAGNIMAYTSSSITTDKEMQGSGISSDPFIIMSIEDLSAIYNNDNYSSSAYYKLGMDLNFKSEDSYENSTGLDYYDIDEDGDTSETLMNALTSIDGGNGWSPIPTGASYIDDNNFTGSFDGDGHTISNLYINRSATNYIGLFGSTSGAEIYDLGMVNVNVTGDCYVGGLVGMSTDLTLTNCYVSGSVAGSYIVGGLVGNNCSSTISNSYATGVVSGGNEVGGLIGRNYYYSTISNSYATGVVSGGNIVGGLVGNNDFNITVTNSYATGTVSGSNEVGGLVGYSLKSTVTNSYATGTVSGSDDVGGLIGRNYYYSTISNSYATGTVSGSDDVGGLVGYSSNSSTVSSSYYDSNTTGMTDSDGGTGKSTEEMQDYYTFDGWDFDETWVIEEDCYPNLRWEDGSASTNYVSDNAPAVADGTLVISDLSSTGFMIGWTAASDVITAEEDLAYQVLYSTTESDVSSADENGDWETNITSKTLSDLTTGETYYFNVFVMDESGNISAYDSGSVTFTADETAPTVADVTLEVSDLSSTGFTLSWTAASDDRTAEADLAYQVLYSTNEGDISSADENGDWETNITSKALSNLTAGETYYFNVFAMDESGNTSAYDSGNITLVNMDGDGTSSDNPFIIASIEDLAAIYNNSDYSLSAYYELGADLDFTSADSYEDSASLDYYDIDDDGDTSETLMNALTSSDGGNGWSPIGEDGNDFTGSLNGAGYTISNLYINRSSTDYVGLIRYSDGGTISDLTLDSVSINGNKCVGGLAGFTTGATISNVSVSGVVEGSSSYVGGLVGDHYKSTTTNSSSNCTVTGGDDYTGGLVGSNCDSTITDSYATGAVTSSGDESDYTGGLVGRNYNIISNCYATGAVSGGNNYNGGLVGYNEGEISSSYATGAVSGVDSRTGGLVGSNHSTIENCYATGNIDGGTRVGGLVGKNESTIITSYSIGTVTSDGYIGGLIGQDSDDGTTTVSSSYYNSDNYTGANSSESVNISYSTTEMQTSSTYSDWDISIWLIEDGSYPTLQWQ